MNVLLDRKLFIVNIIASCLSGGRCDYCEVTLDKKLVTHSLLSYFGVNYMMLNPPRFFWWFLAGNGILASIQEGRIGPPRSAASRRFLVQISAQNLSQILNVCVIVCTKQTQKGAFLQRIPFRDKSAYTQQNPFCDKIAYLSNYSLDM